MIFNRFLVQLLEHGDDFCRGSGSDPLQRLVGSLVAGLQPLEVEDAHRAELRQLDGHSRIDDAVHRGSDKRQRKLARTHRPGEVDVLGVNGGRGGGEGDLVESVGPSGDA